MLNSPKSIFLGVNTKPALFKREDYCPSIEMAENREMKEKV